ncbi:nucleoside triphosphate pyrophosphohydrolase [Rubrivirga marina]|uniref:nucleoside triphosphate pyrophosphohydrolase n=1 Tax=Rubrivirga marina TaxID=1196024 RepID=UPI001C52781E|nr:nucleoside triphosphate pyrophosphohydrolase [Rubrivirga marina]
MPTLRHTPFPYDVADLGLSDDDRAAAHARLFEDFVAIVRRLRRECPWDVQQTHDSTKHLTIEEAYELVDAIDAGDPDETKKELGDLFLHVLFHAHIAETDGTFDLADVMRAEMTKLVRRHPHVFGDEVVGGTGDVLRNWEAIKRAERAEAGTEEAGPSALDGVPDALPALLRAERVQEKAAAVGFDFPTAEDAWAKVREEAEEVREAADLDALEDEVGDLLFAVVNYARLRGVVPETALRRTVAKFSRRFRAVEADLGDRLAEAGLEEMDAAWDAAKAEEPR